MRMSTFAIGGHRRRYAAPIGGIFIILCLIGLMALIGACFNFTRDILNHAGRKHQYEWMLLPVVMFDPPPFEDAVNFDGLSLLQSSIWATLLGEARDKYDQDDNFMLVVPASDVDVTASNLFGPDVVLNHGSFGDFEISYVYDEDTRSYHVPVDVITPSYTPSVEKITRKGDTLWLRVGYVPPSSVMDITFTNEGITNSTTPAKYMNYELHRGRNGYYIYAVRDVEGAAFLMGSDAVLPSSGVTGAESSSTIPDLLPEGFPATQQEAEGASVSSAVSDSSSSSSSSSASSDAAANGQMVG